MNSPGNQKLLSFLGIAGAFLIVAVLVGVMLSYNRPPPLDSTRIDQRKTALAEIRQTSIQTLSQNEWLDQTKGIVRLNITNAMEVTLKDYQNPAAARSNLIARAEKANAQPPPPPAAPNKYE